MKFRRGSCWEEGRVDSAVVDSSFVLEVWDVNDHSEGRTRVNIAVVM